MLLFRCKLHPAQSVCIIVVEIAAKRLRVFSVSGRHELAQTTGPSCCTSATVSNSAEDLCRQKAKKWSFAREKQPANSVPFKTNSDENKG